MPRPKGAHNKKRGKVPLKLKILRLLNTDSLESKIEKLTDILKRSSEEQITKCNVSERTMAEIKNYIKLYKLSETSGKDTTGTNTT